LVSFFGEAKKETPVRRGQTAVGTSAKRKKHKAKIQKALMNNWKPSFHYIFHLSSTKPPHFPPRPTPQKMGCGRSVICQRVFPAGGSAKKGVSFAQTRTSPHFNGLYYYYYFTLLFSYLT
jgi:hypothetical protein